MEIKTNSELGSEEELRLRFYTAKHNASGGFNVHFSSIPRYRIQYCRSSMTNFPSDLPADRNKIWRITLTKTSGIRLQIHCNNVEVLNTLLSDTTCDNSKWSTYWNRDVKMVNFQIRDTASDSYKLIYSGTPVNDNNFNMLLC